MSVSAEDREKAIVIADAGIGPHRAVVHAVDALIAAGWGPAGVPVVNCGQLVTVLIDHPTAEYREAVYPDGPWGGWGWVCVGCDEVLPASVPGVPRGVPFLDWVLGQHRAARLIASGVLLDAADIWDEAREARDHLENVDGVTCVVGPSNPYRSTEGGRQ